jgi:uncharacterized membrane protein
MLNKLRESGRLSLTLFLFALSAYCVLLSAFRFLYTGTSGYLFLNWNLFLAFLPWLVTSVAVLRNVKRKIPVLLIMAVWLLFFPNSLYILTDLIHLGQIAGAPLWLDIIIVLSFAWAGLCFGFMSLMDIEFFLKERFHAAARTISLLSICMIYVAAFGIYIGRFWRWNSWDLFGNPAELMQDMLSLFKGMGNGYRVFVFTILMGSLLNFMYFPIKHLKRKSLE